MSIMSGKIEPIATPTTPYISYPDAKAVATPMALCDANLINITI
ncbi:hypothetical protein [Deferribacter abyssi]